MDFIIIILLIAIAYLIWSRRSKSSAHITPQKDSSVFKYQVEVSLDWQKIYEKQFSEWSEKERTEIMTLENKEEDDYHQGDAGKTPIFREIIFPSLRFSNKEIRRDFNSEFNEYDDLEVKYKILGRSIKSHPKTDKIFGDMSAENLISVFPGGVFNHKEAPMGPSELHKSLSSIPLNLIVSFFHELSDIGSFEGHEVIKWPKVFEEYFNKKGIKYSMSYSEWYYEETDNRPFEFEKHLKEDQLKQVADLGNPVIDASKKGVHVFTTEYATYFLRMKVYKDEYNYSDLDLINKEIIHSYGLSNFNEYANKKLVDKK